MGGNFLEKRATAHLSDWFSPNKNTTVTVKKGGGGIANIANTAA